MRRLALGLAMAVFTTSLATVVATAPAAPAAGTGGSFVSVPHTRIYSNADGMGTPAGPVPAFATVSFQATGAGPIPASGVSSILFTLTEAAAQAGGYTTTWPAGAPRPGTAELSFGPNGVLSIGAESAVGTGGRINIYNGSPGTIYFYVDVSGYWTDGTSGATGTHYSVPHTRIVDTVQGTGVPVAKIPAYGVLSFQVTGVGPIPASGVAAVSFNLTVRNTAAAGFANVYPSDAPIPWVANITFPALPGGGISARSVSAPSATGRISFYNGSAGPLDLLIDVQGYDTNATSGSRFVPVTHTRIVDTISGTGAPRSQIPAYGSLSFQAAGAGPVPSGGVTGLVFTLTVRNSQAGGFTQTAATGAPQPGGAAADVSFPPLPGGGIGNEVESQLSADGRITVYNQSPGGIDILVDVSGYFGARPLPPATVVSTTHVANVALSTRTVAMAWTPGTAAVSGVAGYSWAFNQSATTEADDAADGGPTTLAASSPALGDGAWYFHVKTIDNRTNPSDDKVFGPIVINPAGPASLSLTLPSLAEAASDQLGLEQFFPLARHRLGTAEGFVHLGTGNVVVAQNDATIAAQGLGVVVKRVYNAQERANPDGLGPGWRLSVTDVAAGAEGIAAAVGDPLGAASGLGLANAVTVVEVVNDVLAVTGALVEFTDGDGTTHRFVRKAGPGGRWDPPPGVDLRLREGTDDTGAATYDLVRPDGVTYRATNLAAAFGLASPTWRVTSVIDRNQNRLTYGYQTTAGLPATLRLKTVRHSGVVGRDLVRFDYDAGGALTAIVAQPGHSAPDPATGTPTSFERRVELAYDAGRLSAATQAAQASPEQGRRTTGFDYWPTGELKSVTDARGKATNLAYTLDLLTPRLTTLTDRRSKPWSYNYLSFRTSRRGYRGRMRDGAGQPV